MNKLMARILPFILFGISIVIFVVALILFTYLVVYGALVGLVLFAIVWIKSKLFSKKKEIKRVGHTIDHDDTHPKK